LALQKELTKTLLQVAAKESKQEQPPKKEEPKFQPFSGKKYSLRG
jgi:ubiquitin fusion degradation protein 1